MTHELDNTALMLKILNKIELFEFLVPNWISLSELCANIDVKNNTVASYLKRNFQPEKDYKKKGGKIYVGRDVALSIRKHYVK